MRRDFCRYVQRHCNAPNTRKVPHIWSKTPRQTLQTREKFPTFGAKRHAKPSKREKSSPHLEQYVRPNPPNARKVAHVWSKTPRQTLQTREKSRTFGAKRHDKLSKRGKSRARLEHELRTHHARNQQKQVSHEQKI